MIRYGVYLPNFGPFGNARTLARLAHDAEEAGWDGFFIWDHIAGELRPERMVDPWVALAAIALNTNHIRIGALVTPLPRRRPWKVARETVSVDHLSDGRLTIGVGIGNGREEWDNLGEETDLKSRGEMLDEALEVLAGLWQGKPFSYDGQFYHLKDKHFQPVPVQVPRIPVWVAGFWPNKVPLRRAARWDGVFPLSGKAGQKTMDNEVANLKEVIAYVREQRKDNGPFDIVYAGPPTPGNDLNQAADIVAPYAAAGITWWLEDINPFSFGKSFQEEWPLEAMHQRIQQGPPIYT